MLRHWNFNHHHRRKWRSAYFPGARDFYADVSGCWARIYGSRATPCGLVVSARFAHWNSCLLGNRCGSVCLFSKTFHYSHQTYENERESKVYFPVSLFWERISFILTRKVSCPELRMSMRGAFSLSDRPLTRVHLATHLPPLFFCRTIVRYDFLSPQLFLSLVFHLVRNAWTVAFLFVLFAHLYGSHLDGPLVCALNVNSFVFWPGYR